MANNNKKIQNLESLAFRAGFPPPCLLALFHASLDEHLIELTQYFKLAAAQSKLLLNGCVC